MYDYVSCFTTLSDNTTWSSTLDISRFLISNKNTTIESSVNISGIAILKIIVSMIENDKFGFSDVSFKVNKIQ